MAVILPIGNIPASFGDPFAYGLENGDGETVVMLAFTRDELTVLRSKFSGFYDLRSVEATLYQRADEAIDEINAYEASMFRRNG